MSKKTVWCLAGVIIAIAGIAGVSPAQSGGSVALVREGKPAATIVLAEKPTCSAQFAAAELQYHVKKITGAVLPIVADSNAVAGVRILVGESKATAALNLPGKPFEDQEYLVKFLPDTIVLMGKDADNRTKVKYDENDHSGYATWPGFFEEQATCYAVYDFLESACGVRWFRPGELGMVCPETATLTVSGEDVRRSPEFKYRHPYPILTMDGYDMRVGLWNWGRRTKKDQPQLDRVLELAYPEMKGKSIQAKRGMIRLFLLRLRLGGEPYKCGHSFYGYYDRFWKKNPKNPDVFEGAHPEWFAQGYSEKPSPIRDEAKRYKRTYYEKPPQMCFTNPEFIQQVIRDARNYFDGKGKKAMGDYFALGPMDNRLWCKCPACQALVKKEALRGKGESLNDKASDYFFAFVNKVAREIKKSHPDKHLSTIAYSAYGYPPSQERVESNVAITFCLHIRAVYSPTVQENDRKVLQVWDEKAKGNRFSLWLYYLYPVYGASLGNFNCFPGFFAHGVDKAFKLYHHYGARGAFFEGLGQDVEVYVTCKLMDDSTQNVDKLLADYFTGMYGNAAKPMKEFYLKVEEIYSNPANHPPDTGAQEIAWKYLGTEERMAELGKLMAQAHAAAKTDAEKARVKLFDQQIWKYMTTGRQKYLDGKGK